MKMSWIFLIILDICFVCASVSSICVAGFLLYRKTHEHGKKNEDGSREEENAGNGLTQILPIKNISQLDNWGVVSLRL